MKHRITAYNTATESTNKIHDDDVARALGFRGGLVPGVDVYAYLCHVPAAHWGRAWLTGGSIDARFESPVYDGDDVRVDGELDGDGAMLLELRDPSGTACAVGRAALVADQGTVDAGAWPSLAPPAEAPPASADALTRGPLGSIAATFHADRAAEYLDDVRDDLALFRDDGYAHPGWLLRFANYVLSSNVRLGPWIHVASRVQLLGPVVDGDRVETRALVLDVSERRGHHFVELDVLQVVGDRPVTRTAHTAIYRPRGT